jgi:membrane fusion protein, multidrug efflux system
MGYDEPSSKRPAAMLGPATVQRHNPWIRRGLLAILAIGIGGYFATDPQRVDSVVKAASGLLGQQQQAAGRGGRGGGAAVAPVRVATAQLHDVPVTVHTIGTVLANSVVTVKSQIDGPLLSAGFKEGQMVKKGDLLFQIDPAPFDAALRQAQAQVERDKAQLASAQADADRAVMLSQRGIVSEQQRDQLVANSKALAATVTADAAAVERAQLNLGYTTIRSPVNGKTGAFLVFPGNQVHANDANGLVTIAEIQPVKITFNLPQGDLPQLQDRMREGTLVAEVTIRSDVAAVSANANDQSGMEIPVKVDFVGNAVDDRTGTIELRATFDNPDLRLVPGELVDVSVTLENLPHNVTVPREAVNVGQNGNYVFVIDDNMEAKLRPVKVRFQDQTIAALDESVKPGERVVTDGQLRLIPGTKVTITKPENTPDSSDTRAAGTAEQTGQNETPPGGGRGG